MWDLPGPGLEPVSLALEGGFLTTAPPGKPPGGLEQEKFFFAGVLPGCHSAGSLLATQKSAALGLGQSAA